MAYMIIFAAFIAGAVLFFRMPVFGATPSGDRKKRILRSSPFRDGTFQNIHDTPQLTGNKGFFGIAWLFFFGKKPRNTPERRIPSVKTDLKAIPERENVLVWFGHSSYFLQIGGKKILVDPVFSGHASPFSFTTKSFPGSDIYDAGDFPDIDYLILTHDHYDHLDYKTILAFRPKISKVIASLGVGAHLERWGYRPDVIHELDWGATFSDEGFSLTAMPARHFSGRLFKRNGTLWSSFVLKVAMLKIYIGGDSGYDTHFADIGSRSGPFDLALLECGQYNENWKFIHMRPEQVVQAAKDLRAKTLMPVHWGKFALALHPWDEPPILVTDFAQASGQPLLMPRIGEKVNLDGPPVNSRWWEN